AEYKADEECYLTCQARLAVGDCVYDTAEGKYEVLEDLTAKGGSQGSPLTSAGINDEEPPPLSISTYERRYRLRILSVSKGSLTASSLMVNQAVKQPADIYSFGSVIAWLVTDGNNDLLQQMQQTAGVASYADSPGVHEMIPAMIERAYGAVLALLVQKE